MSSAPPPDAEEPTGGTAEQAAFGMAIGPAARQVRRLSNRRARRGPDAEPDDYDAAVAKGIEGERVVGAVLEERLADSECVVLHSTRFLRWGDIDHIVVGPGGITIVDSKNWSGEITVRRGAPAADGRRRPKELAKLEKQCDGVRLALLNGRPDLRLTNIQGVLCLAAEPERPLEPLSGGFLIGGSSATAAHAGRSGPLSSADIDHVRQTLERYLPSVPRHEIDELHAPVEGLSVALPLGQIKSAESQRPARRTRARTPARRRTTRRRRSSLAARAVGPAVSLGVALAMIGALTHLHLAVPSPAARIAHLRLAERRGVPTVSFTASKGAEIELTLERPRHRYTTRLRATGRHQSWRVPRSWRHARSYSVRACAIGAPGKCSAPMLRAQLRRVRRQPKLRTG